MPKRPITSVSVQALDQEIISWGEPSYRTGQVFQWLYKRGVQGFSEMTNLSRSLRERLEAEFEIPKPSVEEFKSADGTRKFRFTLADETAIESVWIPEEKRNTLCISSQVGCPLKCAFCVTGAVGFKRNLAVHEIVDQVRHVKSVLGLPVSNIVFMGMGEPLLNPEAVASAVALLSLPDGLAVGKRKITVSTVGILPNLVPFFESTDVKIAVSLTGATDSSRDAWMPINRKYNLESLFCELRKLDLAKGRRITFEVVLIADETDTQEQAEKLAELLKGAPAKVNVIPYNENPFFPKLKRPTQERVEKFAAILREKNITVMVRKNRGEDILAACGQLAGGQKESSRKKEELSA